MISVVSKQNDQSDWVEYSAGQIWPPASEQLDAAGPAGGDICIERTNYQLGTEQTFYRLGKERTE